MTSTTSRLVFLSWFGASLVLVFLSLMFAHEFLWFAYDDAYISYRYAWNWSQGLGLVFNPGERVEGYSNFLWVGITALGFLLGLEPVGFTQFLGLLSSVATLGLVAWMGRRQFGLETRALTLGLFWMAASNSLAAASVSGLESTFFGFLVTLALACFLSPGKRFLLASAFILVLASMTRFEGALVFGVLGLCLLMDRERRGHFALWAAIYLVLWGAYFLARWSYFGDPLPNTFYAKVGATQSQFLRGLHYAWKFSWSHLLIVLGWSFLWLPNCFRHPKWRACLALVATYTAYIIAVGGDWGYAHRFFAPLLGPMALLVAGGCQGLWSAGPRRERFWHSPGAWLLILGLALSQGWVSARLGEWTRLLPVERSRNLTRLEIARWLQEKQLPEEAVIALGDVGLIPFKTRLKTLDMLGLTDRHIARVQIELGKGVAGHEKGDLNYVLESRPHFILSPRAGMLRHPIAQKEYRPVEIPRLGRTVLVHHSALPWLLRHP